MKIAQLAPLWESVPPKTYGGTELVVYSLCEQFKQIGHDVTLFACGDSKTSAKLDACVKRPLRESGVGQPYYYEILSMVKVLEKANEFDIIHNHIGFQFLPFAKLIDTPVITTLHGAFVDDEVTSFYRQFKHMPYISISDYQRKGAPYLNYASTVYNGIDVEKYEFSEKPLDEKPYFAFLGRISEEKGTHLAIELALKTDYNLIIAAKLADADREYYEEKVKPLIDGKKIIYIGEVGHCAKCELLKGAVATLHTVMWPEPFGLVMAESMACGTPVLALKDGSIPEVISDGKTGFIANDIETLLSKVKDIKNISREACRKHIEDNFSSRRMANGYLDAYRQLINKTGKVVTEREVEIISSANFRKK